MADHPASPWPIPQFHFQVTIGDKGTIVFQEVSGLDMEDNPIEYRKGEGANFSTVKMPGLHKNTDVTLKKGLFKNHSSLLDYFMSVNMNTINRLTVTIQLLDEEHNPLFTWTLKNAYPL
ncbi:MAG: phage tail protein, partial [Bacteroidota bacterium]